MPGDGGVPLTVTKTAVEEGLKKMSDAVETGPRGGVVWCKASAMGRGALSCAVRPFSWSTEKQATPAMAPPLRTQAGRYGLALKP